MTDHGFTAGSLAERLGGSLRNCPEDRPIREASPLGEAGAEALSFVAGQKYRDQGRASGEGAPVFVDSAIPQAVHRPGSGVTISGCMGQV